MLSIGIMIFQVAALIVSTGAVYTAATHRMGVHAIAFAPLSAELSTKYTSCIQISSVCNTRGDLRFHQLMLNVLSALSTDTRISMADP